PRAAWPRPTRARRPHVARAPLPSRRCPRKPVPHPAARPLTTTPTRWKMARTPAAIARVALAFALFERDTAGCQAGIGREDQTRDAGVARPTERLCFLCASCARLVRASPRDA